MGIHITRPLEEETHLEERLEEDLGKPKIINHRTNTNQN
jgi:hypothetical protein